MQLVSIDGDENVGREKSNHFTETTKQFTRTKCLLLNVNFANWCLVANGLYAFNVKHDMTMQMTNCYDSFNSVSILCDTLSKLSSITSFVA